ncbi:pseudouridine synthase [Shewanella sp. SR44-3]|uniref:pseudouridine synthase n=1 Tax=unclassified Shewanella TaxID=196818 RepID=UPI0015FDF708|nr:16S rRNA pseudouridine(516) synthase [Shewanella sp. SR44-3]MBB1268688.1 pseudouridine synthase [Shewanella sp. SR44-3]
MASKRARLDQFLATKLQVPRKSVRFMLLEGRVSVNGVKVSAMDMQIDEFSRIECDGLTLQHNEKCYLMLNKPVGVVSATKDDIHKTAVDLLHGIALEMLHIAGRLDLNSSGLLLITNDARWSQALMSPNNKVTKKYLVSLANPIDESYIKGFAEGMYFDYEGMTTQAAGLEILSSHQARVSLNEGKYHQIKRMFGRFRNPVIGLHREAIGELLLDEALAPGEFRHLTPAEVALF